MAHINLNADQLRTFVREELERRDMSITYAASKTPNARSGYIGISLTQASRALNADGDKGTNTLIRMLEALGFDVEKRFAVSGHWSVRRRLHD